MPMPAKATTLEELVPRREADRAAGRRVVWTNGCFDLFHAGHAASLRATAALGDVLVVGLNDDASVRALKGPRRPYCTLEQRATVLDALACVDHILPFGGERCVAELETLCPDLYVKGEDYTLETVDPDERRAVEKGGGRVVFRPLVPGLSSSLLEKAIRRGDPEKIISAAFALHRDGAGRLLLVACRYAEGIRWGLPGGGQHRGETLEETVRREVREETGLEVEPTRYAGVIERLEPALDLHLVLHLFETGEGGGAPRLPASPEENVVEARYVDAAALRALPGWVLGREHWLAYLEDPSRLRPYIFMGPGEE